MSVLLVCGHQLALLFLTGGADSRLLRPWVVYEVSTGTVLLDKTMLPPLPSGTHGAQKMMLSVITAVFNKMAEAVGKVSAAVWYVKLASHYADGGWSTIYLVSCSGTS